MLGSDREHRSDGDGPISRSDRAWEVAKEHSLGSSTFVRLHVEEKPWFIVGDKRLPAKIIGLEELKVLAKARFGEHSEEGLLILQEILASSPLVQPARFVDGTAIEFYYEPKFLSNVLTVLAE